MERVFCQSGQVGEIRMAALAVGAVVAFVRTAIVADLPALADMAWPEPEVLEEKDAFILWDKF